MDEQQIMELFLERVDQMMERVLEETEVIFPLTPKAARMDTTQFADDARPSTPGSQSYKAGWRHPDFVSKKELRRLERSMPEMFKHVFRSIMDRTMLQDGHVLIHSDEGELSFKLRSDLTLEDIPRFQAYLEADIERQQEEVQALNEAAMIWDVSRTTRKLAGEDVPEDETYGEAEERFFSDDK